MGKKILSVINFILTAIPLIIFILLAIALIFFEGTILDFDKMIGVVVTFGGILGFVWPIIFILYLPTLICSIILAIKMLEWKKFNKITLFIAIINTIIAGISILSFITVNPNWSL